MNVKNVSNMWRLLSVKACIVSSLTDTIGTLAVCQLESGGSTDVP